MAEPTPAEPTSSLVTVPENFEDRRAFLQARVALFGKVLACLAKAPDERPVSAAAIERALGGIDGWTQEDARSWWKQHRAELAGRRRRKPVSDAEQFGPTLTALERK